jgi:hypothetical protein
MRVLDAVLLTGATFLIRPSAAAFDELHGPANLAPPTREISESDSKGWNSSEVRIAGFKLGLDRVEAFKTAQRAGVSLDDQSGLACLKAKSCQVLKDGKYRGISLQFDPEDVLEATALDEHACPPQN